jgi:hypothetical protein
MNTEELQDRQYRPQRRKNRISKPLTRDEIASAFADPCQSSSADTDHEAAVHPRCGNHAARMCLDESNTARYITFRQLAEQCRGILSLATLRRYLRRGILPHIQPAGPKGKILFPIDVISRLPSRQFGKTSSYPDSRNTTKDSTTKFAGRARWARRLSQYIEEKTNA